MIRLLARALDLVLATTAGSGLSVSHAKEKEKADGQELAATETKG